MALQTGLDPNQGSSPYNLPGVPYNTRPPGSPSGGGQGSSPFNIPGMPSAPTSGVSGNNLFPMQPGLTNPIPGAQYPGQDPRLGNILNNQITTAQNYRSQIPQMAANMYDQYAASSRKQLAGTMKKTDADFNQRGLLRSGQQKGAQYGNQAGYSNDLANSRYQINSQLLNNANTLEGGAVNTAGIMAGLGGNLGNALTSGSQSALNLQGANSLANQQIFGSVGGGLGSLAGTIAANNWGGGANYSPYAGSGPPSGYAGSYTNFQN